MVFFELRWNYSPLKEKAVLLPDGLFICFVAALHTPLQCVCLVELFLLLMQAARRPGPRGSDLQQNFGASLHAATVRLSF